MTRPPADRLEHVVAAIQQRWGVHALRRLERVTDRTGGLLTGLPALDHLLGCGVPRGAITCFSGDPTSGKTTLALDALARAQAESEVTVYIDFTGALDPEYAEGRSIDLDRLPVARPRSPLLGLAIARDIMTSGGAGLLVVDAGDRALASGLPELARALRHVSAAVRRIPYGLLFLTTAQPDPLSAALVSQADLHLHVERLRWLWDEQRMSGYEIRLTVLKTRIGPSGRWVALPLAFEERRSRL